MCWRDWLEFVCRCVDVNSPGGVCSCVGVVVSDLCRCVSLSFREVCVCLQVF